MSKGFKYIFNSWSARNILYRISTIGINCSLIMKLTYRFSDGKCRAAQLDI